MNCANHPDRERVAFCQNCGKPLCSECVRQTGSSVFCEPCLTARVAGAPPAGYGYGGMPVGAAPGIPQQGPGEPNPGIAALLGFIPGVGAMYNEQYAKGIVHLIVFALLVSLSDEHDIFGIFIAGWIAYMVIEAHHTAKARRDGTPLPNPFGLNDLSERLGFGKAWPSAEPVDSAAPGAPRTPPAGPYAPPGANPYAPPYGYTYVPPVSHWGAPQETGAYGVPPVAPPPPPNPYPAPDPAYFHRFPSGAIWLIALGAIFLLGNTRLFPLFHGMLFGPLLLIGVGVWIFVSKMTGPGYGMENDGTAFYHWRLTRALRCSFWIVLTGAIWLLDVLHILPWSRSWPIYIIGAGVVMAFGRMVHPGYGSGYGYGAPPVAGPPPGASSTAAPVATTEIVRSDTHSQFGSNGQEGR